MKRKLVIVMTSLMICTSLAGCSFDVSQFIPKTQKTENTTSVSTSAESASNTATSADQENQASETGSTSISETPGVNYDDIDDPFQLEDLKKEEEARRQEEEAKQQQETETPEEEPTEGAEDNALEELKDVKTSSELVSLLKKEHDNSAYGKTEGLVDYVGKVAVSNVAYSVSDQNGLESDVQCKKLLNLKLIRKDFQNTPIVEESHEYFDQSGKLLFTIEDVDFIDGESIGKYRIKPADSDSTLSFYSDAVNIAVVEEYDMWADSKKDTLGQRTKAFSAEEIKEKENANADTYGDIKTIKDLVKEEKFNAVASAKVYYPKNALADESGYVQIPSTCLYAQNLLNGNYIEHSHEYKLNNKRNYIVFCDKDGKQLFTINHSDKTSAIDLSVKMDDIKTGYQKGKIKELYPASAEIAGDLEAEAKEVEKENREVM